MKTTIFFQGNLLALKLVTNNFRVVNLNWNDQFRARLKNTFYVILTLYFCVQKHEFFFIIRITGRNKEISDIEVIFHENSEMVMDR